MVECNLLVGICLIVVVIVVCGGLWLICKIMVLISVVVDVVCMVVNGDFGSCIEVCGNDEMCDLFDVLWMMNEWLIGIVGCVCDLLNSIVYVVSEIVLGNFDLS